MLNVKKNEILYLYFIELKPKENFNDDHVDYTKFTKELHQMFSSKQKLY